ncbi:MAG TPA: hypothetical protein VI727_01220 [Candidatus Brocadiaceae bacterium]|nr:hypothetical protein [Candidatus Brocadiaceae bacterium]
MALPLTTNSQISTSNTRIRIVDVDIGGVPITGFTISSKTGDGIWEIYIDRDISTLDDPSQPSLAAATTGGNIPRSQKIYVRLTAIDANGLESPPSLGNKFVTTGATTDTNKVTVSWSAITGAVSYNVYAGTKPNSETLVANVVGTSLILTDLPADAPASIPSAPDIIMYGKKGGTEPMFLENIYINYRLIVYCQVTSASEVGFSLLVG